MPSLCDMQAARPKCDRACGPSSDVRMCGVSMRWFAETPQAWIADAVGGVWVCRKHGPMMDGREAAERAGYAVEIVEAA